MAHDRRAQVASQEVAPIPDELFVDREVESQGGPALGDELGRCLLSEGGDDRIAGDELHHEESRRHQDDDGRDQVTQQSKD